MPERKGNYVLTTLGEVSDQTELSKRLNHTQFYDDLNSETAQRKGLWSQIIGEEVDHGKTNKSRFLKNFERLMKQSSSGIEQILEDIKSDTDGKSESIFANAVDWEELKERFPSAITIDDPLSSDQKKKLHEAIQADGAVARGLAFWREFLLGSDFSVQFGVRKKLSEENFNTVSENISKHPDLIQYLDRLQDIDEEVQIRQSVQSICDNLFGFGRSVLLQLYNHDGIPVRLVPLSSFKLGKIVIDANTFEFIGVEYGEIKDRKNILLANDMIYFYINDNNVTPQTRYFGRSIVFYVMSIAETNRINREINFPEIIKRRWASTLLIKTSTRNAGRNQKIVNDVNSHAGGAVIIPDLVSAENIKIDTEMSSLINYANEQDRKIIRDMKLPNIAAGFGSDQANAKEELNQWTESTLTDLRSMIEDILVKQWYEPNLRRIMEFELTVNSEQTVETENVETETEPDIIRALGFDINDIEKAMRTLEDYQTFKETDKDKVKMMIWKKLAQIATDIYAGVLTPRPTDIISLTDGIKFPWRIKLEYDNIVFDTFLDRAAGVIGYTQNGIIDKEVGLDLAKLGKYKNVMKKKWLEEKKAQDEQKNSELERLKTENEMMKNGQQMMTESEPEKQTKAEQNEEALSEDPEQGNRKSGAVDIGASINRKIGARTSRGRVGG